MFIATGAAHFFTFSLSPGKLHQFTLALYMHILTHLSLSLLSLVMFTELPEDDDEEIIAPSDGSGDGAIEGSGGEENYPPEEPAPGPEPPIDPTSEKPDIQTDSGANGIESTPPDKSKSAASLARDFNMLTFISILMLNYLIS